MMDAYDSQVRLEVQTETILLSRFDREDMCELEGVGKIFIRDFAAQKGLHCLIQA